MTYGTAAGIGAQVPRFSNSSGTFDTTTRPTLAAITAHIASISALIDSALSATGFTVPITDTDITPLLDYWVENYCAGIVIQTNGSLFVGPLTDKDGAVITGWQMMAEAVRAFVASVAVGLERIGAARVNDPISGMGYKGIDDAGITITPLFQRKAFGNVVKNWDV